MTKINKRGFTLIEVLIVVAIISVISLIFTTDLSNTLNKTETVKMRQNAKSLETAAVATFISDGSFGTNGATYTPDKNVQTVIESVLLSKGYNYATTFPSVVFEEFDSDVIDEKIHTNLIDYNDFFVATNGPIQGTVFSKKNYVNKSNTIINGNNELSTITPTNLIGYWNSKKGFSGNTWYNIAFATTGQYNGNKTSNTALSPNGVEFYNAIDSKVTLPVPIEVINTNSSFTLEFKFNLKNLSSHPALIRDGDGNGLYIDASLNSGSSIFVPVHNTTSNVEGYWVPYSFENNVDYMYTISYNGDHQLNVYINGNLLRTINTVDKINFTRMNQLTVGRRCEGYMDNIKIYSTDLSSSEVLQNAKLMNELGGF